MIEVLVRGSSRPAVLDDADARLTRFRWYLHTGGYAFRKAVVDGVVRSVYMHRLVCGLRHGDGLQVDHLDHDKLNNVRANLRVVTGAQNAQNVTGRGPHRGVCHDPRKGWYAKGWFTGGTNRGSQYRLGYYPTALDAGRAAEAFRRAHLPYAIRDRQFDPVGPCPCRDCRRRPAVVVAEQLHLLAA